MSQYWLGIDLGTTFTAAAIARPNGAVEGLALGSRSLMVPSVVLVRGDGEILVGEAADRRAATEPSRVARDFKRRLGDPSPLFLGGSPYSAEALMALVLRYVMERALEREGAVPQQTVITHPASWSQFKIDLLRDAVRQAGIQGAVLMTEPEAAALHYGSVQRISTGETVAVYDFGGGTFDSAVLTATDAGYALTGSPEGIERLGGVDFDQAILSHVNAALGGALADLDPADPAHAAALADLRTNCRAAKEALSEDSDATIAVNLPDRPPTQLRITRGEFEELIAPRVDDTIDALERTIASAGRRTADISRILPVGGSSRIPLVHQRIREVTGRPLSFDTDPNLAIAQGAAALARQLATRSAAGPVPPPSVPPPSVPPPSVPPPSVPPPSAAAAPLAPPPWIAPTGPGAAAPGGRSRSGRRTALVAGGAVAAIAAIAAIAVIAGGEDDAATSTTSSSASPGGEAEPSASSTTTTTAEDTASEGEPVTYTGADGRSTTFGGLDFEIEEITLLEDEDGWGPIVRIGVIVDNTTDGDMILPRNPLLRLEDEPAELQGKMTRGASSDVAPRSTQKTSYDFVLPEGAELAESTLAGSVFLVQGDDVLWAGIPLDGDDPEPPVIDPTPVTATISIAGNANGELTVSSARPMLDAEASVASSGDAEADDFRAASDGIWIALDLVLDCRGGTSGQDCYFGLEEQVIRIEVDGAAEGLESTDSTLFEMSPAMPPGTSDQVVVQLMVARGTSYTLLLGEPDDEASVIRVPLEIADDVTRLFDSVARFQPE